MVEKGSSGASRSHSGCFLCGKNYPFSRPDEIVQAARRGSLVIFAGAGVSTEVPAVFPTTLYKEIVAELGDVPTDDEPFPVVMKKFEDDRGRDELIRKYGNASNMWSRFRF